MAPSQPFILPVHSLSEQPINAKLKHFQSEQPTHQVDIFSCLALNKAIGGASATLEALDLEMGKERIFYTCRAVRRLLLGIYWYPAAIQEPVKVTTLSGSNYEGPGLIINPNNYRIENIKTQSYLQTVWSLENTDNSDVQHRVLYCPTLMHHTINYQFMFRIICKYITVHELDDCFTSFICYLNANTKKICTKNYFKLLDHLISPMLTYLPVPSYSKELEFYTFNVRCFVSDWPINNILTPIKKKILENLKTHQDTLLWLCKMDKYKDVRVASSKYTKYQTLLKSCLPHLVVLSSKKHPGNKPYKVEIQTKKGSQWFCYSINCPIYRVAMCILVAECFESNKKSQTRPLASDTPTLPHILASMFQRCMYAPRDKIFNIDLTWLNNQSDNQEASTVLHDFAPMQHLSVNGFKINIFNTNMVINTKIICYNKHPNYKSILNIPRLTNNFVVKKFSVKEPSFTISVFYSDDAYAGTAININFSGDMLNFMFAMGNLKCFLPIMNISPVSIANWNSTLDLHGLENQHIVRSGRGDVFWTTNFPSVVSTRRGFNVSWFKAATATISKIHGNTLATQIINESTPILSNNMAKINHIKNSIFSLLEYRNKAQVQTLHKRFLECLYECTSFFRLDVIAVKNLTNIGVFDFSKHTISHTKTKHECAIMGYKKCNMVPKVLTINKKVRLDEMGRNANFMTFIFKLNSKRSRLKQQILRHILRRYGLQWKCQHGKIKRVSITQK
ncbi:ORF24 [Felid gammaherpesvirus 1]|uniref:ORF24 n=1 Tax=Felid gammaherpesvirus 1 TaxID=2560468 RepID=A0A0M4M463_9GAMA|nr:ORF24 [Felis catus gammaherpesvirus 1]ALE14734.1 ORF24 [Felis catus gammaherpesvirus 1]